VLGITVTVTVTTVVFALGVYMLQGNRAPVVQTRQPTEPLADERIAQMLTDAFAPHRCTVEFQDDRRKVALRVRGPNGAEYVVEGKRLDLLRDLNALTQYIKDVRHHLSQHRLRFYVEADLSSTGRGSEAPVTGDPLIDVDSWRDVRYWSRRLGCTQSVLRAAVNVLGPRVKDVEPYVKRRRHL
jgi:hypothetical protein